MQRAVLLLLVLSLSLASTAEGGEKFWQRWKKNKGPATFLTSGDYRHGEEIVGVFLTDEEYGRMIEGIAFQGVEFDWSYLKAEYRKPRKPTRRLFDLSEYATVRVLPAADHAPVIVPNLSEEITGIFTSAAKRLGLELVEEGEADLEIGVAIVDYKADSTYIYVGSIDPFIELEVRVQDLRTGEPLLLIRNQDHNTTPEAGAAETAGGMVRLLR